MNEQVDRIEHSLVVPVYNEEGSLDELSRRLGLVLDRLGGRGEVIFVDDGSSDRSYELMLAARERDDRFKIIRLSRNFGHEVATTAGVDMARGDAIVIMDADLQDPPEVVEEMVARWREGVDVVYTIRDERPGETWFKRRTAVSFYRLFHRLAGIGVPLDAGDFRLVDRRAADAFRSMRESNRYVRGMFGWIGFRQEGVHYTRAERFAGETKYSLRKLLRLAIDGIVSFSSAPLRVALNVGFFVSMLSFLLGVSFLIWKLVGFYSVPGLASIAVYISFLGGIQLLILGVIGEYIARIHDEVKRRPLYLVSDAHGVPDSSPR